jgi:hypothetical protein
MSMSRTVRAAVGLPLAAATGAALALGSAAGCNIVDEARDAVSSTSPSASASAANGIDKLSPSAAFARASKATLDARSVRVRAQVKDSRAGMIRLDYQYSGRDRAKGSMRIGEQQLDIIRIGKVEFQKGNRAYHEDISADVPEDLIDKWVKSESRSGSGFGAMSGLEDLDSLFKEIGADLQGWTFGKPGNIGGTPSVSLNGAGQQFHIASQGAPYVLRVVISNGRYDFLAYNAPVSISEPPAGQVLDTGG